MQPRHRAFKQELDRLKQLIPQERKLSQDMGNLEKQENKLKAEEPKKFKDIQNLEEERKKLETKKAKELFDVQTDLFFIFLEKFSKAEFKPQEKDIESLRRYARLMMENEEFHWLQKEFFDRVFEIQILTANYFPTNEKKDDGYLDPISLEHELKLGVPGIVATPYGDLIKEADLARGLAHNPPRHIITSVEFTARDLDYFRRQGQRIEGVGIHNQGNINDILGLRVEPNRSSAYLTAYNGAYLVWVGGITTMTVMMAMANPFTAISPMFIFRTCYCALTSAVLEFLNRHVEMQEAGRFHTPEGLSYCFRGAVESFLLFLVILMVTTFLIPYIAGLTGGYSILTTFPPVAMSVINTMKAVLPYMPYILCLGSGLASLMSGSHLVDTYKKIVNSILTVPPKMVGELVDLVCRAVVFCMPRRLVAPPAVMPEEGNQEREERPVSLLRSSPRIYRGLGINPAEAKSEVESKEPLSPLPSEVVFHQDTPMQDVSLTVRPNV